MSDTDKTLFLMKNLRNAFAAIALFCFGSSAYLFQYDMLDVEKYSVPKIEMPPTVTVKKTAPTEENKPSENKDVSTEELRKTLDESTTMPHIPEVKEKPVEIDTSQKAETQSKQVSGKESCQERGDCWKLIINKR